MANRTNWPFETIGDKRCLANVAGRSDKQNPGALAGATGAAKITVHSSLGHHHARGVASLATHFWDCRFHSVQPICELGAVLG